MYHNPVLLKESISALNIKPDGIYVDATFGGGGHANAILDSLDTGLLIGFDQDPDASRNIPDNKNFIFIAENFRYLKNFLRFHRIDQIDGLLADLGVSSHQFDTPERGFSTRFRGKLDMRMDTTGSTTAGYVVNEYDEAELIRIFRYYGELPNARRLAGLIISYRENKSIDTTESLEEAIKQVIPRGRESKFMARVFQSIRLEVNDELNALKDLLIQSTTMMNPSGRIAMITYHSLEDRLVKNYFRAGNFDGIVEKDFYGHSNAPLKLVNRKPMVPSAEEIQENNRARSAKLRIAEKI